MNLNLIREQRAGKVAEMRTLLAKAETEKRNLNSDEQSKFEAMKADITALEGQEQRATFLAETERCMMGEPVKGGFGDVTKQVSIMKVLQAKMENRSLDGAELEYHQETERRTGRKAQGVFIPMAAIEQRVNTTVIGKCKLTQVGR
jgi:hypothetical protein